MLERSECITQPRALLHHLSAPPLKKRWLAKRVINVLLVIKRSVKICLKFVKLVFRVEKS